MIRILLVLACAVASVSPAATAGEAAPRLPVLLLPSGADDGGTPARFQARAGDLSAWFTADGFTLTLLAERSPEPRGSHVRVRFQGARAVAPRPERESAATVRRYRGAGGGAPARACEALRYEQPWPGVDVLVHSRDGRLAYDLLLEPGADLDAVVLRWEGGCALSLPAPDRLLVETPAGVLEHPLPAAWQLGPDGRHEPVAARFRLLDGQRVGFQAPDADPSRPLVIDPLLQYGSYIGGQFLDRAVATALLPDGDVLVGGTTYSLDFPDTPGAFQGSLKGTSDAFAARIDGATGQLVWATYLGGTDDDFLSPEQLRDLAPTATGGVVLVGDANSADFPTTPSAYAPSRVGGRDVFVTRLQANGALAWSTYLGSTGNDEGRAVALDGSGRPVVAGVTFSSAFPVSRNAYDDSFNSLFFTNDVFVVRLSSDGSELQWSTYLGGALRDDVFGLVLDDEDGPVLGGLTGSSNFPTTPGAYDPTYNGSGASATDAWLARLSPEGDALTWSTFYGGTGLVEGRAIALGPDGGVLLAGLTQSADLPGTASGFQAQHAGGLTDGFVAAFSGDGSTLRWASYLGGAADDRVFGVAVTAGGQATVTGDTTSPDFPLASTWVDPPGGLSPARAQGVTGKPAPSGPAPLPGGPGPSPAPGGLFDGSLGGGSDAFLARFTASGERLVASTLLGGNGAETGHDLALDDLGTAVVVGETASSDLPTTADAADGTFGGTLDGFVVRLALPPLVPLAGALAGRGEPPRLLVDGTPEPGRRLSVALAGGRPGAVAVLAVGSGEGALPLAGGTLHAWPLLALLPAACDEAGSARFGAATLPGGAAGLVLHAWVRDDHAPGGWSATHALALAP